MCMFKFSSWKLIEGCRISPVLIRGILKWDSHDPQIFRVNTNTHKVEKDKSTENSKFKLNVYIYILF